MGTSMAGQAEVDQAGFVAAWRAALTGVKARGKAELGDKTMIDALTPAIDALEQAADLQAGLQAAVDAAQQGMNATTPLVARKGRASYLGDRSAGHQDPGATSTYYLFKSAAETLAD
jgi:dihydroxyacetone kinase-like protein